MPGAAPRYTLNVIGGLTLLSPQGVAVPIKGLRARGLLALLALSPNMRRSRRWIEAHMWSQRDPSHAGNSLRQELRQLRKVIGAQTDLLGSDRNDVWLNAALVHVDVLDAPKQAQQEIARGAELLEGLAIPDQAFADWLARMRSFHGQPTAPQPSVPARVQEAQTDAPHIVLALDESGSHAEKVFAQFIGRQVAQSVSEVCPVEIASDTTQAARLYRNSILISPAVVDKGTESMVLFEISQPAQGKLIWADNVLTGSGGVSLLKDKDLIGFANYAGEQVARGFASDALADARNMSDAVRNHTTIQSALDELFSFDSRRLPRAEQMLKSADYDRSGPLIDAWLALLCSVRLVERETDDPITMRARAEEHLLSALAGGRDNPTILGIVSQVISFLKIDDLDACNIAEQAVKLNPWNPMAKLALGLAQMRRGKLREGYQTCSDARAFASRLSHRHWWDMSFSLAALARARTDEAIEAAEKALSFHPHFRPPMRHLYALYLNAGQYANAGRMLERMRALEPDFSLKMMREDPDYPMVTIRTTPLGTLTDVLD